jgi:hypothetical protein
MLHPAEWRLSVARQLLWNDFKWSSFKISYAPIGSYTIVVCRENGSKYIEILQVLQDIVLQQLNFDRRADHS